MRRGRGRRGDGRKGRGERADRNFHVLPTASAAVVVIVATGGDKEEPENKDDGKGEREGGWQGQVVVKGCARDEKRTGRDTDGGTHRSAIF